ncbi:glycosyltransferase family 9 protein [Candidatus Omnitrophota bacterium]
MRTSPSSVLIINTFGIGDVLFSTPLIRSLKENFPQSRITYLCNRRTEAVLKSNPLIDKTIVYERDEFEALRRASKSAWAKKFFTLIKEIKAQRCDLAVDLSLNSQFGFFTWCAGIKRRAGLNYKRRGRFLTDRSAFDGYNDKHVAEYYLDVLRELDLPVKQSRLEVYTDFASRSFAADFIAHNGLKEKLLVGIAPCGGQAFGPNAYVKRWPPDKYAALIARLAKEYKAAVLIFAGPGEKREVAEIIEKAGRPKDCYEFTDATLAQTIALVEQCALFIGNDTGPLRFADGLDKKIIALFGPVDEKVYGLYPHDPKKHIVITKDIECRPCYKKFKLPACDHGQRCLKDIDLTEVLDAVKRLVPLA